MIGLCFRICHRLFSQVYMSPMTTRFKVSKNCCLRILLNFHLLVLGLKYQQKKGNCWLELIYPTIFIISRDKSAFYSILFLFPVFKDLIKLFTIPFLSIISNSKKRDYLYIQFCYKGIIASSNFQRLSETVISYSNIPNSSTLYQWFFYVLIAKVRRRHFRIPMMDLRHELAPVSCDHRSRGITRNIIKMTRQSTIGNFYLASRVNCV